MIDTTSWLVVAPEIALLVVTCAVIVADLWVTDERRTLTYAFTQVSLLIMAGWLAWMGVTLSQPDAEKAITGFGGMVILDAFGAWLKCLATFTVLATLVYARPYSAERGILKRGGELFTLTLFGLLGINIMISGNHLLIVYLGLEVVSLASFALVALRRGDSFSVEAGMKYFILGSLASGFLLYGLSMLYGATGTMYLPNVLHIVSIGGAKFELMMFAMVFIVAGLAFKLGAAPFHMWLPDVYHGAPTGATLFVATAPKLGVFAVLIRLLIGGMLDLAQHWQMMLVVLGICSLVVGNLAAIMQSNLKRMLAYSTIGQNGFMLLVFAVSYANENHYLLKDAASASLFYLVGYVLATIVSLGVILMLSREGFECDKLDDLKGLGRRYPFYTGVMMAAMLSLAGVPLTVGFYGKFRVIQVLLSAQTPLHTGLALFAVLMSLIGAFYYLRVIKIMCFDDEPETPMHVTLQGRYDVHAMLAFNGLLLMILGILPAGLMQLCQQAVVNMILHMSSLM